MMDRKCGNQALLFTTGSLVQQSSGPYRSLIETGTALRARGHDLTVLGTIGKAEAIVAADWTFARTVPFERSGPASWHIAPGLGDWLKTADASFDAVCIQNIWLKVNNDVARWAYRHGLPYMITPHGNFNEVALRFSPIKKRIARFFLFEKMFARARCFQALNEAECRAIRAYGIRQPICVIPHGVRIPPEQPSDVCVDLLPEKLRGKKIVLFLGRLHPIKNVEGVLRAWSRLGVGFPDWRLVIAGGGQESYRRQLEELAGKLNLQESVEFVGHVEGRLKSAWFSCASVFVLSSFSEGLPVAALEAMAARTSVLLTRSCNIPEIEAAGAGILTDPASDIIANDLKRLLSRDERELNAMGDRARELVQKNYSWDSVCERLEEVFLWMKKGGNPPACVRQS